jgi:hypothetical protein
LGDGRLQPGARVADDPAQRAPGLQFREPGRTAAIVGLLPHEPHQAVGLDADQDYSAVEEDLIEAADQDQRPAGAIEWPEDPAGGGGCGLAPTMVRRTTRGGAGAQEDGQQGEDLVEAQAHGQGGDGELHLLGRRELDGLGLPVPELGVLAAEGLVLWDQFVPSGPAAMLGLDGGQDLPGMIVGALAATAGLPGLLGDGAVGSGEAGGGIGDPADKG